MNPSTYRHPEMDLPKVIVDDPDETSFLIEDKVLTSGAIREASSTYDRTLHGVSSHPTRSLT
jgi:hypothetical protein